MKKIPAGHELQERSEAAYQGRLTASMTHEFKNVLAIIGETAGLMEDLLEMCEASPGPRFSELLGRILAQVERGQRLSGCLNRFAHLTDTRPCSVELAQLTTHVTAMAARLARLVKVQLVLGQCVEAQMHCDPVALHRALFLAMEHEWKRIPAGGALQITCGPDASGYTWRLAGEPGEALREPVELDTAGAATLAEAGLAMSRAGQGMLLVLKSGETGASLGEEI